MALRTIVLYGNPGAYSVNDPALFNRQVVLVHREGTQYDLTYDDAGTPGNREYFHEAGKINFAVAFNGPTVGRPGRFALERIHVTYKV
jgi:hypothetical protein